MVANRPTSRWVTFKQATFGVPSRQPCCPRCRRLRRLPSRRPCRPRCRRLRRLPHRRPYCAPVRGRAGSRRRCGGQEGQGTVLFGRFAAGLDCPPTQLAPSASAGLVVVALLGGVASWGPMVEAFACYQAESIRPRPICPPTVLAPSASAGPVVVALLGGVAFWRPMVEAFACYQAEPIRPRPIWSMLEFGNPTDR